MVISIFQKGSRGSSGVSISQVDELNPTMYDSKGCGVCNAAICHLILRLSAVYRDSNAVAYGNLIF